MPCTSRIGVPGGLDVGDEQAALHRRQVLEAVGRAGALAATHDAGRSARSRRGRPARPLDGVAGQHRRVEHAAAPAGSRRARATDPAWRESCSRRPPAAGRVAMGARVRPPRRASGMARFTVVTALDAAGRVARHPTDGRGRHPAAGRRAGRPLGREIGPTDRLGRTRRDRALAPLGSPSDRPLPTDKDGSPRGPVRVPGPRHVREARRPRARRGRRRRRPRRPARPPSGSAPRAAA